MNLKIATIATLAFFIASLMATVILAIPEEILEEDVFITYPAIANFSTDVTIRHPGWWIAHKLGFATGIGMFFAYAVQRQRSHVIRKGVLTGLASWFLVAAMYLGLFSVGMLPAEILVWWSIHYIITALVSGYIMGLAVNHWVGMYSSHQFPS